jgi:hypothetical protein
MGGLLAARDGSMKIRRSRTHGFDTDPIRPSRRQGRMATPELISLIVALIVWIVLLGTISTDA